MKRYLINALVILFSSLLFFQGCIQKVPQIKEGEFYIESSLPDKVIAGEKIKVYYHLRKDEQVDCFIVALMDYYQNVTESFCPLKKVNDTIVSAEINVLDEYNRLFINAVGNMNCRTGGYASSNNFLHSKDGQPKKGFANYMAQSFFRKEESQKGDSVIDAFLKANPDDLMILAERWLILSWSQKISELQLELEKIKNTPTHISDEKLAVICKGYCYLKQADSAMFYMNKYLKESNDPGFAPQLYRSLFYLFYTINRPSSELKPFLKLTAMKCPCSLPADWYLEDVISAGQKDSLAEKIIEEKLKHSLEDLTFKARYEFNVLHHPAEAREAALKYLDFEKDAYFPKAEFPVEMKYIKGIPQMNELLADAADNSKGAYLYMVKAIERNKDSKLKAKAAEYAFKSGDIKNTNELIMQICKSGDIGLARNTIKKTLNSDPEKLLLDLFDKSASLCDTVSEVIFEIDSLHKISTNDRKIIVLNLWGPFCAPCVKEIPLLNQLRSQYSSDNIAWLAQDYEMHKEAMKQVPHKFENWSLYKSDKTINDVFYKVSAIPQTYIIDKDKRIRYHRIGGFEDSVGELKEILEMLIKE